MFIIENIVKFCKNTNTCLAKNHVVMSLYRCGSEFLGVCEMLEIQNQPQVKLQKSVNSGCQMSQRPSFKSSHDGFDRSEIDAKRDGTLEKIDEQRQQFDDLADEWESSDNKYVKKAGKGVRFISTILGLAGTFVVAKYSSKVAIETLKSVAKSPAIQKTVSTLKTAQEPAKKALSSVKGIVKDAINKPIVKDNLKKVVDSKAFKVAKEILNNKNVAKVLEPLKNTLKSIKEIKINGTSIQAFAENTMAASTTGSVFVDTMTGRNNDKSNIELAAGV